MEWVHWLGGQLHRVLCALGVLRQRCSFLMIGLDNAGKTSLLQKLKYGQVRLVIPTQRAKLEEVCVANVTFAAWDLGGHAQVRSAWRDYFISADAVCFMLDAADLDRTEEARDELALLLTDPALRNVPVCVLANKCDLEAARSFDETVFLTGARETDRTGPTKIFRCSVLDGTGYAEALLWLASLL